MTSSSNTENQSGVCASRTYEQSSPSSSSGPLPRLIWESQESPHRRCIPLRGLQECRPHGTRLSVVLNSRGPECHSLPGPSPWTGPQTPVQSPASRVWWKDEVHRGVLGRTPRQASSGGQFCRASSSPATGESGPSWPPQDRPEQASGCHSYTAMVHGGIQTLSAFLFPPLPESFRLKARLRFSEDTRMPHALREGRRLRQPGSSSRRRPPGAGPVPRGAPVRSPQNETTNEEQWKERTPSFNTRRYTWEVEKAPVAGGKRR